MFCKECGAEIPDDSKHCKECGAKLHDTVVVKENNMKKYGLITGVVGGLVSLFSISEISFHLVPESLLVLGLIFSLVSIYGTYSMYKEQEYGRIIFIISIIVIFISGRQYNFLGLIILIVTLVLFYLQDN